MIDLNQEDVVFQGVGLRCPSEDAVSFSGVPNLVIPCPF